MKDRKSYPNLLVVGGTGRNSGKTSFICQVINKFKGILPLTGLKVSAVYPMETRFHGSHIEIPDEGIHIFRETDHERGKDTSRMMQAGASEVWFISASDERLCEGFDRLLSRTGRESIMICESNSLTKIVKPGLFIMIKKTEDMPYKQRVLELEQYADLVVNFENGSFEPVVRRINFSSRGWFLSE